MSYIDGLFVNWKTVPNLLSVIRIALIPVFAILYLHNHTGIAVLILVFSGLTDFFDGKIARKFNQISALGKVLDPVADKLTQITIAFILFVQFHGCISGAMRAFSWVFLFFIAKEGVMVGGGALMLLVGLRPGAAEIFGKLATFAFYSVMGVIFAFGPEIGAFREYFQIPEVFLMVLVVISALLTLTALLSYTPGTIRMFKERKESIKAKEI